MVIQTRLQARQAYRLRQALEARDRILDLAQGLSALGGQVPAQRPEEEGPAKDPR
jgi:hypothetical protein